LVRIGVDCHQIVTKTAEFFNRRPLALDICVSVAHRDTDAGMSQQFFHRHDVNATVYCAAADIPKTTGFFVSDS
jgi:hypothetical protein